MNKKKAKLISDLAREYRDKDITPNCQHFGECGGCMFQDIQYEDQLILKKRYLNIILEGVCAVEEVLPSIPYEYRNRMDLVTAFRRVGLRRRGDYREVVDIDSCKIMQPGSSEIFSKVKPFLCDVEDYDYLKHSGYLRYIVLREGGFSGQVMVNFVVSERENRLAHPIENIIDEVDSISIILNDGRADLSFGEILEDIKGGYIEDFFGDIKFRITPNSFFQSNSRVALEIYKLIREDVIGKTLDLYSGVGSISLYVAEGVGDITGVELSSEAIRVANINRINNNIDNVRFVCDDALKFLRNVNERYDTIILDPPRSGINPRMVKYLNMLSPDKIIYLSCNPDSFKNDFQALGSYSIEKFYAFDMFPQTPHIETLGILKRMG
ncbi:MAG: 23S rRNA (uracil(1939)-C(5))-methyltransferase RlmD [Spirochaetota bacterium]|nr:23S rRNA (uracil(1939)-C(5))-methyltransferase RlmD [Spirochaetota bacterium]